jgi:type IV secretory pathway protease TraF
VRARLVLAGLSACGLAALAWASFVQPLPRLTYNPSDSVAVGWYRIDPFDPRTASLPRPLSVDSIVLVPLPPEAAALAAQRGYLPTRVPLLKRGAPQHVCIAGGVASTACRRRVLPADRLGGGRCHPAVPPPRTGRTVPAERDQSGVVRQPVFRPVSASAVIGVAHPVWLETRP